VPELARADVVPDTTGPHGFQVWPQAGGRPGARS